ncbi:MAG: Coq4 family protein [Thermodesulfobacteriota bacterium]
MDAAATSPIPKRDWPRAWRALRTLIADSQRTDQVFEIIEALAGDSFDRCHAAFAAHPDGTRLLRDKPSLIALLSDGEALRRLPEGSLGRAYVDFMEAGNITAEGLVEADEMAARNGSQPVQLDPDRQYFADRNRDVHDLWHVVTGYGMDEAGEAANLAFTQAQLPNFGVALILLAAVAIGPKDPTFTWARYLLAAWRRGKRTPLLTVAPWEELLPLPLDDVRRRLGVPPVREFHPDGVIVGNRVRDGSGRFVWSTPDVAERRAA